MACIALAMPRIVLPWLRKRQHISRLQIKQSNFLPLSFVTPRVRFFTSGRGLKQRARKEALWGHHPIANPGLTRLSHRSHWIRSLHAAKLLRFRTSALNPFFLKKWVHRTFATSDEYANPLEISRQATFVTTTQAVGIETKTTGFRGVTPHRRSLSGLQQRYIILD